MIEPMPPLRRAVVLLFFAIVSTITTTQIANAYYVTGNDLLRMCTGSAGDQRQCAGYLQGDLDMLQIKLYHSGYQPCPPPDTKIEDVRDAVVKFLRKFPKSRGLMAPSTVGSAIGEGWKCAKQKAAN